MNCSKCGTSGASWYSSAGGDILEVLCLHCADQQPTVKLVMPDKGGCLKCVNFGKCCRTSNKGEKL